MRNAEGGTAKRGAVSHRPNKKPVVLGQRVVKKDQIQPAFKLGKEGLKMWDEAIPVLMSFNAATLLDVYNLTLMCSFWQDIVSLRAVLEKEGSYDIGSTGQMRRSPIRDDYNHAVKEFNKLSTQYGMTLASRTGLALTDVTTRSLESDLNSRLGPNPRRTNRTLTATAKKQIEAAPEDAEE